MVVGRCVNGEIQIEGGAERKKTDILVGGGRKVRTGGAGMDKCIRTKQVPFPPVSTKRVGPKTQYEHASHANVSVLAPR